MRRPLLLLLLAVMLALVASCASTKGKRKKRAPPPLPPAAAGAGDVAVGKEAISDEVRQAVSQQLECPADQLNIICVQRDRSGECISVRALGCDKEIEYKFGTD